MMKYQKWCYLSVMDLALTHTPSSIFNLIDRINIAHDDDAPLEIDDYVPLADVDPPHVLRVALGSNEGQLYRVRRFCPHQPVFCEQSPQLLLLVLQPQQGHPLLC
jgi:hypothetical protein